ncbi:MAG: AarF/UbiB family protein [Planctomycetota bacterium]
MNLASIPQLYRNARRWREVIGVLSKHGLADWLSRINAPLAGRLLQRGGSNGEVRTKREERVRLAFEELGPAFIKLGQVLATRPDLVGVEMADELTKLQTGAPASPPEEIRQTLERELGRPVEDCFASFDEAPVASASIGQVHRATLQDGSVVAVKVRHEGVKKLLRADLEILLGLADLAERIPELAVYRPLATAREFERQLRHECDLGDELQRLKQFGDAFRGDERVRFPKPIDELSTEAVLTEEWLEGVKLSEPGLAARTGADLAKIARHGAEVYLEMIFEHGLYHADPHPGNLMVMPDGVIGIVDFGMVGRVTDTLRENLEDVLIAVAAEDPPQLTAALLRIGAPPEELDETRFAAEIVDFVDHYGRQEVGEFDLRGALTDLVRILREQQIALPSPLAMLLKLLIMLEGTAQRLAPRFSLLEVLAPLQRRMVLRRLSPTRQAKKARRLYGEVEQLAEEMPRRIRDLLNQFQSGRFEVQLEHGGLEPSVNRLVLGLLTSALIVGGSLMLSREVLPLYGVSAPGVLAFALSALLGLRLLWAIAKSGWLDSH